MLLLLFERGRSPSREEGRVLRFSTRFARSNNKPLDKLVKLLKHVPWFVWLTAILYSLIYAFYYKYYSQHVPAGWVWVGGIGGDDSVYLGLMQSVVNQPWGSIFGAESPWHMLTDPGSHKILLTPEFSSPYWFYFLGILSKLLHIAPASFMILTRVVLSFLLPISVWVFLLNLGVKGNIGVKGQGSKNTINRLLLGMLVFLFYFFVFGLGGLYFLLFSLFKEGHFNLIPFWPFTAMGNAVTYELFEGVGLHPLDFLGRTYYVGSIILGLLSLVKLSKAADRNRVVKHRVYWGALGGLSIALSQAIYPITGVGFVVLAFLYLLVFDYNHAITQVRAIFRKSDRSYKTYLKELKNHFGLLAFFTIGALGGLPWFISLLLDNTHFVTYGALKVNATPWPLVVSTATLLIPSVVFSLKRGYKGYKGYRVGAWFLLLGITILLFSEVFPFRTVLIYLLGGGLALLSFIAWEKEKKVSLFFWLWLLFSFFASIMPIRHWTPFLPARFMLLMWLPLSVLGAYWFVSKPSSSKGGIRGIGGVGLGKFTLMLVTLSLGSLSAFFYSTWFLRKPLRLQVYLNEKGDGGESLRPEYITVEEYETAKFLQTQPQGSVLTHYNFGMYLPLLSNQKSLLGRDPMVFDFYNKVGDYEKFFSIGTSAGQSGQIIEKYKLSYVIFGPKERAMSNDIVTMKNFADWLELIGTFGEGKERKLEVWRVK